MKRLLFVDDVTFLLQALQRMLRPKRHQWEMVFVEGGAAALEAMAAKPFDVVVTDMKMPGMDGAALLREVAKLHPGTVRIILSGQADPEQILGCVDVTHQFLTKPCAAADLIATIERVCSVEWVSTNAALGNLLSRLDRLPSIPSVYNKVVDLLNDPDCSIDAVGAAVACDPGMLAKILKLVNSAFFGAGRNITNPGEAVSYIGSETLKALILVLNAFSKFSGAGLSGFPTQRHWSHATAVAARAKAIAQIEGASRRIADEAFAAGLLHDAGQLILAANLPGEFSRAIEIARTEGLRMEEAERRVFCANHAEVASHVFALWGLPSSVVTAVALHHRPMVPEDGELTPLLIVHFADAIENETSPVFVDSIIRVDETILANTPFEGRVDAWRHIAAPAA